MYKQHQVVLVATDKAENALILTLQDKALNIYILSEEKIEVGDWFLSTEFDIIGQLQKEEKITTEIVKKIIASTNKSLTKYLGTDGNGFHESRYLPQIPQSFIEYFITEFNKGNVIDKVNVEYEEHCCGNIPNDESSCNSDCAILKLKISKSNEINIKPIKESWNRDEVKQYAWYAVQHSSKLESAGQKVIHRKDIDNFLDLEMD